MGLRSTQKEPPEGGLRLVSESPDAPHHAALEKQFVNFIFLRVSPEWRKMSPESKDQYKREFEGVFDRYRSDFLLYSYSLVGFDSKADLMFWRIGTSLDLIQEMTAGLYRTDLGSFFETNEHCCGRNDFELICHQ